MRSLSLLIATPLLLAACAHYHVHTPEPERIATQFDATSTAKFWGASRQDVQASECKHGMDEVRVRRDFGQWLMGFVTLGAISPVSVDYYCRKAPPPTGTIELDEGGE